MMTEIWTLHSWFRASWYKFYKNEQDSTV